MNNEKEQLDTISVFRSEKERKIKKFIAKRDKDKAKHLANFKFGRNTTKEDENKFLELYYTDYFEHVMDNVLSKLDEYVKFKLKPPLQIINKTTIY